MVMNANDFDKSLNYSNNKLEDTHEYEVDKIIFKIILSNKHTEGKYSMIEISFPPGSETEIPLHSQSKEIVIVYANKGNFLIRYGENEFNGNEGTVWKFEKNIPRSFKKIGDNEGQLLVLYIPGGFENFFKDLGSPQFKNSKKFGYEDPVITQLLEKNYGTKIFFE